MGGRDGGSAVAVEDTAENDELREASCRPEKMQTLESVARVVRFGVQYCCVCRFAIALVAPSTDIVAFFSQCTL